MIKIDECVTRPELGSEFLSRDHLAVCIEQQTQDTEALFTHFDFGAELPQFSGTQVERVGSEQSRACGRDFCSASA